MTIETLPYNPPKCQGTLVLAANHIGCAADLPARSIEQIKSADILVFEEDRPARALLKAAGLHRPYIKYNEHATKEQMKPIFLGLQEGKKVLFISDQGCPSFADPGYSLTKLAYSIGAKVQIIPGPSSITSAISACPFPLHRFYYAGFLPQRTSERESTLKKLAARQSPIIIMDTPYRLKQLLASCSLILGADRNAFLALDASQEDETYLLGTFPELIEQVAEMDKRNFVLIVRDPPVNKGPKVERKH